MGRKNKSQAGANGVAQDETQANDDGFVQEEQKTTKEVIADDGTKEQSKCRWSNTIFL